MLKPSGSIFVNLGDKYANDAKWGGFTGGKHVAGLHGATNIGRAKLRTGMPPKSLMLLPERYRIACVDQLGLIARAVIVWSKPNGLPESVTDRVRRAHEDWVHLTKRPRYFSAVDEIREPHTGGTHARRKDGTMSPKERATVEAGHRRGYFPEHTFNPLGKLPGSVWEIPSEPLIVPPELGVDHFAAFPTEWPRRLILGWSPSGICTACGEGRRPISRSQRTIDGAPVDALGGWKRGRGQTAGIGNYRFGTDRTITGEACACTPRSSNYGKRGDWTEGRAESAEHGNAFGAGTGNAVPRRPGGFGTKVTSPERPLWEYDLENWTPPPTRPAVVLDPFGGTGTTALVASVLGRIGISVDMSADYCRLARWRTNDPGERARAMRVPKPEPVDEDQMPLFEVTQ